MPEDLSDFFEAPATLELVAAIEHERWSHWQRYLHDQCSPGEDGSLVIPAHLVARWSKQMSTPYADLSDKEKDSDREQAQEYITAMQRELNS